MLTVDLRMHGAKNVGHYQATSTSIGIEFHILAVGSSTNTIESNGTLNRSVDALDCHANNTPLVVRQVHQ